MSVLDDYALQKSLSPWSGLPPHCWHCRAHCGFRVKRAASNSGCWVRNSVFQCFSAIEIWMLKKNSFPISLLHIYYIFMGNSWIHLSNQHAMELICSSWSSWVVVAHAHVWGLNGKSYQKGFVPSPCLQHLSQYLHTKPCTPLGALPFSWVLGLGRAAAQPLMLLSFHPQPVPLGAFFGICLTNKLSVRVVLTQASYYQSQGTEVGKPTESIGGNDFRANLKSKDTPSEWFETAHCDLNIWKHGIVALSTKITVLLGRYPSSGFQKGRSALRSKATGFYTHCPC